MNYTHYKTFFEMEKAGYPIKAAVSSSGRIIEVTYGAQTDTTRSYNEACKLIGAAILHAACCEGVLSNVKLED